MNEKSLRLLEFHKIRDTLAQLAVTELGAQRCLALMPHSLLEDAQEAQEETQEAFVILTYRGDHPLENFRDVRPALGLARKGATLSMRSLLDIAQCLRAAASARAALAGDKQEGSPRIRDLAQRLEPYSPLQRRIGQTIISEEEMSDDASPALSDIRRHIRLANERIRDKLQSMVHSAAYAKYLQEAIITVRNGRFVIPVRQEYRQNVPGLVHDESSTGATVFIEPMAVVEAGNELKQWAAKEQQEINRILLELSGEVAAAADAVDYNITLLSHLDFAFAKGRLAQQMRAIAPKMNNQGRIRFVRVRHPLIDPAQVVPCDLWLGEEFTTLVITGPNTGGKTVTLKTAGLITLMAQAGLHVPGDLGTEIALFHEVFADIGDEQSIEQSLSTFSSHMTNIVEILAAVEQDDLVLFDELGAGTDPTEGAALAQAILERLLKHRVRTVATTHYSELKAFALTTDGVENASVEFDVATLRPTYRLSIGIPGKSNAFDISKRLGLPESLIARAKETISHDSVRFEDVISSAEYHRQIAEKERLLAQEARQDAQRLRAEAQEAQQKIMAIRAGAEKKAKEDGRRILEKTKRECAAIIEELKSIKTSAGSGDFTRRLRELDDSLAETMHPLDAQGQTPQTLQAGDQVEIPHMHAQAVVLAAPDAKGEVTVQAGAVKMRIAANRLRKVAAPAPPRRTVVQTHTQQAQRSVGLECDVRGLALDEALAEVERYLDMAVMAGLHEVSIIHGKGTGTLRTGIQRHLKSYPQVSQVRLGAFGEGESGVSIVTLK